MLRGLFGSKDSKKSDFEIEEEPEEKDSAFLKSLELNLSRLIAYCESADVSLQREVAEKLANEAVNPTRQVQIVELGGLQLLVPLTKSTDTDVQRLAAHALANLSVNADNQLLMAKEGAIEMLVRLLESSEPLTQRQAAKALANLGVNPDNKRKIAVEGGLPKLVDLCASKIVAVKIEAIAAIANLAVNDANELEIVRLHGLDPIVKAAQFAADTLINHVKSGGSFPVDAKSNRDLANMEELGAQCARALRNLSVNPENKEAVLNTTAQRSLRDLLELPNDRISQQAKRALRNLDADVSQQKEKK